MAREWTESIYELDISNLSDAEQMKIIIDAKRLLHNIFKRKEQIKRIKIETYGGIIK